MAINIKNITMMSQDDIAYIRSRQTEDFRRKKFTEFLSPEAQQAMTETMKEMAETARREKEFKDRSLDDIKEESESRAGTPKRNENTKSGKRKRGESQEGVVLTANGKLKSETRNDSVDIKIEINLNDKDDDSETIKSTEPNVDNVNESGTDDNNPENNQNTKQDEGDSLKVENNAEISENNNAKNSNQGVTHESKGNEIIGEEVATDEQKTEDTTESAEQKMEDTTGPIEQKMGDTTEPVEQKMEQDNNEAAKPKDTKEEEENPAQDTDNKAKD